MVDAAALPVAVERETGATRMTGPASRHAGHGQASRIGPNAIIQMAAALDETLDRAATRDVFAAAGLAGYLDAPPDRMVDEREVSALHAAVVSSLGAELARAVSRSAGLRTGDYLLANRIPGPAQLLLRVLPARLASRLLLAAIGRNAWTFAGSGTFRAASGALARISIAGCPICRELTADWPACAYFSATFERLFRVLVHPGAEVRETACEARGEAACVFEVRWP